MEFDPIKMEREKVGEGDVGVGDDWGLVLFHHQQEPKLHSPIFPRHAI